MKNTDFTALRQRMVSAQIAQRGITDQNILDAFKKVPRHLFVPQAQQSASYEDCPLPIGCDQTISQPYMVALMTQVLFLEPGIKVLEVGTGSGYQAAILAELGADVYTIERFKELSQRAQGLFSQLGYNVTVGVGDGSLGWPEYAPYDRIVVTAAARVTPKALLQQLTAGGRLIIPLGGHFHQDLTIFCKESEKNIRQEKICGCIFVPLVGKGLLHET